MTDPRPLLRAAGLRVTPGRVALLASLFKAPAPVSLEDAVSLCGPDGGDPATVYRNLQALVEAGILGLVRGVGRREMYEVTRQDGHEHAHLSCTSCGRVVCVDTPGIGRAKAPNGWAIRQATVTLWGICPECRQA